MGVAILSRNGRVAEEEHVDERGHVYSDADLVSGLVFYHNLGLANAVVE